MAKQACNLTQCVELILARVHERNVRIMKRNEQITTKGIRTRFKAITTEANEVLKRVERIRELAKLQENYDLLRLLDEKFDCGCDD